MVSIKFCGMSRFEDIAFCNDLKPEYIGFIFAPSKRQVSIGHALELITQVQHSASVGVFVNENLDVIRHIANVCQLDVIQLHGHETAADIQYLKKHTTCKIWKALRIQSLKDYTMAQDLVPDRFLLDSYQIGMAGGTGKRIAIDILHQLDIKNLMIAGGITCDNVQEFVQLQPFGIDIASGIETNGCKDYHKMRKIIEEVRKQ